MNLAVLLLIANLAIKSPLQPCRMCMCNYSDANLMCVGACRIQGTKSRQLNWPVELAEKAECMHLCHMPASNAPESSEPACKVEQVSGAWRAWAHKAYADWAPLVIPDNPDKGWQACKKFLKAALEGKAK